KSWHTASGSARRRPALDHVVDVSEHCRFESCWDRQSCSSSGLASFGLGRADGRAANHPGLPSPWQRDLQICRTSRKRAQACPGDERVLSIRHAEMVSKISVMPSSEWTGMAVASGIAVAAMSFLAIDAGVDLNSGGMAKHLEKAQASIMNVAASQ